MDKQLLKEVILHQNDRLVGQATGIPRTALATVKNLAKQDHVIVITGIRRCGKSTILVQLLNELYADGVYYIHFEDERLLGFTVTDFKILHECFLELYGERAVFFFDEIQNVPQWDRFVRRMHDDGYKFFITGSNASLLSKELGTHLTGRHIDVELTPFSFLEFLSFHQIEICENDLLRVNKRSAIKRYFNQYMIEGGMPGYLKNPAPQILQAVYDDIIYRDIVVRHDIKDVKALRELAFNLLCNASNLFSYQKLANIVGLKSANTVKNYIVYLEDSYLFFCISRYSHSVQQQTIANKKIYCIDNAFIENIAFKTSQDLGRYLENIVFLELHRRGNNIFYYKTVKNHEVDFAICIGNQLTALIQVTKDLNNEATRAREVRALVEAMKETSLSHALILTLDEKETIKIENFTIEVLPIYQWLIMTAGPPHF